MKLLHLKRRFYEAHLSGVNITMQGMYYKRRTLIFSFSHHTERKRSASYRNEVEMLHIVERQRNNASSVKADLWSTLRLAAKYEAQLTLHEAALRAMKRNLDRLHVFLPWNQGKKMAEREGFEPSDSCPSPHFQCGAFDHSTISPGLSFYLWQFRI